MKVRRYIILMVITFLLIFMSPFTHIFAAENTTVRIALNADPETVIPFEWRSAGDLPVFSSVYNSLLRGVNLKTFMRFQDLAKTITILPNKNGYYKDGPRQKEMDKLILDQARATSPQKRLAILKKIHAINNADPAQIALLGLKQIYAMNNEQTDRLQLGILDRLF